MSCIKVCRTLSLKDLVRKSKKSSEVTITAYSIYLVMNAKYSVYDDTPHNNPLCFDDRRALYLMKDNSFRRHKNSKTLSLTRSLVLLTYSSPSEILALIFFPCPLHLKSVLSFILHCCLPCNTYIADSLRDRSCVLEQGYLFFVPARSLPGYFAPSQ